MEWGEIPLEQLQMKSYPPDTNANVVVLFDHGVAKFDASFDITFIRHCRIKILNKAGFDWGTRILGYYAGEHGESISKIEGLTTSLGPDGEITQTELESESIFEEELENDRRRIRFTLPALTEGCVIEFKYKRRSDSPLYLPDWEFQKSEPVLWSEFLVETPSVYQYVSIAYGKSSYVIDESKHESRPFLGLGGGSMVDMQILHYAMKDIPALREEPYITTLDDYRAKVVFQLAMIAWPGRRAEHFLETWPKLVTQLLEHKNVGRQLRGMSAIRNQTKALVDTIQDPTRKLKTIYDFIRNGVAWNGDRDYFADRDIDEVLEAKKGNSAEINLLLTSMLREAGIEATPVLLSTRTNGRVQRLWPVYSQFNYLIVQATIGSTSLLLDATDHDRPYTLLPSRALNHEGLLLKEGPEIWIPIAAARKARESTSVMLAVHADGRIAGDVRKSFEEYRAIDERASLHGKKEDEYVKAVLRSETMGITVDSSGVSGKDDVEKPLELRAAISSSTYAQVLDDFLYVNPMVFERTMENPFKLPSRAFPVDMPYGSESTYKLALTIPPGYSVKEAPQSFATRLSANGGAYTRHVEVGDGTVTMLVRYDLTQTYFDPRRYSELRLFYEQIVAREAEQIVLMKNTPPAAAAPAPSPANRSARRNK